jgi:hypothetical protein
LDELGANDNTDKHNTNIALVRDLTPTSKINPTASFIRLDDFVKQSMGQ